MMSFGMELPTCLLDALHLDFLGVGEFLPVYRPLRRLPGYRMRIKNSDDVRRCHFFPVLQSGGRLDGPLVSFLGPRTFAEAAAVVEVPGADFLGRRIPGDPLRAAAQANVFESG